MIIKKWVLCLGCVVPAMAVGAASMPLSAANDEITTAWQPKINQKKGSDSSQLGSLSFNSTMLNSTKRRPHFENEVDVSGSNFQLSKRTTGGLFLYKLDNTKHTLLQIPAASSDQGIVSNSLYGHLLTQVMKRLFVDFAAGLRQDNLHEKSWAMNLLEPRLGGPTYPGKDWFASATALFNHSWKEFAFNANLSAMHSDVDRDPYALYFAANPSPFSDKYRNKVSFLQENAELSYHASEMFQPFIDGGLLQVVDFSNVRFGAGTSVFGPGSDLGLDMNGYKVGGGLAFNYKDYAFRLEQQYYQRGGGLYRSNLSSLSVKMRVG